MWGGHSCPPAGATRSLELFAEQARSIFRRAEIPNVCLLAVVHTFRFVLASRIGGTCFIPYCLAASIAFPDRWNSRSRGFGPGVGCGHAACQIVERAVSDLIYGGQECPLYILPSRAMDSPRLC